MKKWKTISSELAFNNKWFTVQKDVVKLPNGKIIDDYYFWKEQKVSQVVAITKENKIVFVKQYKHGADEIMIECPAGFVDEGETFEDCAKRELLEETGFSSEDLIKIGKIIHNPTKSSGVVEIFLAKNAIKISSQKLDKNEEIEILEVTIPEALKMIENGVIWATGTIASIFLALNKIKYKI